jgi:acyl dehydratase
MPVLREVEKGAVRRYAEAVGNDNPLCHDEEYAAASSHGRIIAPPGFFGWPLKPVRATTGHPDIVLELQEALARAGFPRILDGGIAYDFYLPVRAGDILVSSVTIQDIAEKTGKSGTMVVCKFGTSYLNQNGDLVAKSQQTFIAR